MTTDIKWYSLYYVAQAQSYESMKIHLITKIIDTIHTVGSMNRWDEVKSQVPLSIIEDFTFCMMLLMS